MVAGSSPANPAIQLKVIMKAQVKYLIRKAYMNLRYQWWKAKIFATPNDPLIILIIQLVKNKIYHNKLMSATCAQLDLLTPNDVKNDYNPY